MSYEPGSLLQSCDVLLLTATDRETEALKAALREVASSEPSTLHGRRQTYTDHGEIGGARVVRARCEMGSGTPGGSASTVADAVREVAPRAIIMVGIAFGAKGRSKQQIGTILVSQQLQGYELQRVGTEPKREAPRIILRGDRASASARLVDRLRHAKETWSVCPVEFGLVLSGEKLVDNVDFRDLLMRLCPEAIGGEMEGQGLYVEAKDQAEWILIKAVCDWADGNKGKNKTQYQMQAAKVAANFLVHALSLGGFAHRRSGTPHAGPQTSSPRIADVRSVVPGSRSNQSDRNYVGTSDGGGPSSTLPSPDSRPRVERASGHRLAVLSRYVVAALGIVVVGWWVLGKPQAADVARGIHEPALEIPNPPSVSKKSEASGNSPGEKTEVERRCLDGEIMREGKCIRAQCPGDMVFMGIY